MTRQEKIENIIKATNAAIEQMKEAGTLTMEIHSAIIDNMNHVILSVEED